MFTFIIKDNRAEIEIIIIRILLALAGAVSILVYPNGAYYAINIVSAILLFITSYFVKTIITRFSIKRPVILIIAAIPLFGSTHSLLFTVILPLNAVLLFFLEKDSSITLNESGIAIKKPFSNIIHSWSGFSNVVLKDGILTLDFKNNRLLQLSIDSNTLVDEQLFNSFCLERLQAGLQDNKA